MAPVKVTPLFSIALMSMQGRNSHLSSKIPLSSPEWLFSLMFFWLFPQGWGLYGNQAQLSSQWLVRFHLTFSWGLHVVQQSHPEPLVYRVAQHKMPWWKLWQLISWLTGSPVSVQCRWQKEMEAIMSTSIKLSPVVIQILKQTISFLDHPAQYSQHKDASFNIYPRKT